MATRKRAKNIKAVKGFKLPLPAGLPLSCCSGALDIIMVGDTNLIATIDQNPTESVGSQPVIKKIRLSSANSSFKIPGMEPEGVDKSTDPWRIYVVDSNNDWVSSNKTRSPKERPRKQPNSGKATASKSTTKKK
jgi:hypothetical protein